MPTTRQLRSAANLEASGKTLLQALFTRFAGCVLQPRTYANQTPRKPNMKTAIFGLLFCLAGVIGGIALQGIGYLFAACSTFGLAACLFGLWDHTR